LPPNNFDGLARSLVANDIEDFWDKIHDKRSVKIANCLSRRGREFRDLAARRMNPKNAHGVSDWTLYETLFAQRRKAWEAEEKRICPSSKQDRG